MNDWIEVFRAGTHTDSAGRQRTWTEEDLQKIAESYDPEYHEAPVVVGHPKDNAPAYGWVESLKVEGGKLLAKFKQVAEEFADAVKAGRFKKRSISLYPNMTLRHVGFLGAQPPAVKGLADIKFEGGEDAVVIEFGDGDFADTMLARMLASLAQRLREYLIDQHDLETADRIIPEYLTDADYWPVPAPAGEVDNPITSMSEGDVMPKANEPKDTKQPAAKPSDHAEQGAADERTSRLEQHLNRLSQQLEAERAARRRDEIASFADGLVSEGRLTPAQRAVAVELMAALDHAEPIQFGEGDAAEEKPAAEAFREFLAGLPKQVEFKEVATRDKAAQRSKSATEDYGPDAVVDQEFAEADAEIRKIAKEQGISYAEAAAIYFEED